MAARLLRKWLAVVRNVATALAVIVVGELIPPLRELEPYFAAHRATWITATAVLSAAGVALLVGGGLHMALTAGSPAGAGDQATFAEVKAAWRSGAWRRSVRWRRLFAMAAGAALLLFGLFGLCFVVGPPGVKLLAALAVAYAVARTVLGWMRA